MSVHFKVYLFIIILAFRTIQTIIYAITNFENFFISNVLCSEEFMCIYQSRCLFVFDVCMYMYIFEYVFKLSHLLSANILPFRTCLYINIYKYRYLNIFANGRFIFICWLLFNIDLDFDLLLYFL